MANSKPEDASVISNVVKKPYGGVILTLENCLLPKEKLFPTPSYIDGLEQETETDLRILGCELIQTAGILLKLPQVAMATGQVLFQRFYYSKSFVRHAMETTAMGCVCLASKIEEAPRRIRDVINVFHHIKQVRGQKTIQPMLLDQNYIALKNQVIKAERRVLKELGFCVHVKHPHKLIVMYLQVLGFERHQNLMQLAWNYMNDSLRTDVFVQYQPETVACACIYLTARRLGIPLPRSPSWYAVFRVKEPDIVDICYKILKLYTRPKCNTEMLEKRIEELRRQYQEARQKARTNNNAVVGTARSNSPNSPPAQVHNAHKVSPRRQSKRERSLSRSRSRSRSHSYERRSRKRNRNGRSYSRSVSVSPHKIHHAREKVRHRSRSRKRRHNDYDRSYHKSGSRHKSRSTDRRKERR
ncbi:cyclin-L1 [Anabrus simplex]|uniref:cyclin-L1 n=1 Tax=Anabrus simplex TaxID=316456 RepID=UPI0034DDBAC6